jgi:hypothetical protein
LHIFTKNSNDPKAKAHYINKCNILKKIQRKLRNNTTVDLRAEHNNKVKTTWNIMKKGQE